MGLFQIRFILLFPVEDQRRSLNIWHLQGNADFPQVLVCIYGVWAVNIRTLPLSLILDFVQAILLEMALPPPH